MGAAVYRPPLLAALCGHFSTQAASGLSGFTRTTGERAIPPLPKQKQKPSLHPFPLRPKGTNQNCGRLFAGLTHPLQPQQWVSKGTSPFGRIPYSTNLWSAFT